MPNLAKSELERPRHARELHEWVLRLTKEFGTTSEGKNAVGLRPDPDMKKFIEEVRPLANYAKLFFWDRSDVSFVPVIGDQPLFDAFLREDDSGKTLCYFEVTLASYDYQERLRDEHLCEHGRAPQTTKQPLKRALSGHVEYKEAEAVCNRDWVSETLEKICKRIESKDKKNKKRRCLANRVLIVEFDDTMLRHVDRYREKIEAGTELNLWRASSFSEIAFVAASGDFGFCLNPRKPTASQGAEAAT